MRLGLIVLPILLAFVPAALAQDTGRVTGKVLDHTGAALPGVAIDLVIDYFYTSRLSDEPEDGHRRRPQGVVARPPYQLCVVL